MEKLSGGYYRSLFEELEKYEDILSQLQRDYEREKRGRFIIAIDFCELYNYIHARSKDAKRAALNKYVLNKSVEQFTLLPGSFYELLNDINSITGRSSKSGYTMLENNFERVFRFFNEFPKAIKSYDNAIRLYNDRYGQAEKEIADAIKFLLDEYAPRFNSIQTLQNLLDGNKLAPISGIERLNDIAPALKDRCRNIYNRIESNLNIRRSYRNINNQIDAADSIVAMLLNGYADKNGRYITIYSQAERFVEVLSQEYFKWDNDYLVRNANYLKFRTNLQNMRNTLDEREEYSKKWIKNIRVMKMEINNLTDIHERLQDNKSAGQSLKLLDLYGRFCEECREPLNHVDSVVKQEAEENDIKNIYQSMLKYGSYDGRADQTIDVLKEHLCSIFREMGDLDPLMTDSKRKASYITRIKKWLDIENDNDNDNDGKE